MRKNKGFTYVEVLAALVSLTVFLSFMGSTLYLVYQNHLKAKDLYERSWYSEEILVATKGLLEEGSILQQLENEKSKKEIMKAFETRYQTDTFKCEVEIQKFEQVQKVQAIKIVKETELKWIGDKATLHLQGDDFKGDKQERLLVIYMGDSLQKRELEIIDQEESPLIIKVVGSLSLLEEYFTCVISKDTGEAFVEYTNFFYRPKAYKVKIYVKDFKEEILEEINDIHVVDLFK